MVTIADMLAFEKQGQAKPIFEIMLFEHPDKELIYDSGKRSGFPDIGSSYVCGFYYDVEDAVAAVQNNACDMRETLYDAAFILCRFPGLYKDVSRPQRMYFVWDEAKKEFAQKEEPKIFSHIAY